MRGSDIKLNVERIGLELNVQTIMQSETNTQQKKRTLLGFLDHERGVERHALHDELDDFGGGEVR